MESMWESNYCLHDFPTDNGSDNTDEEDAYCNASSSHRPASPPVVMPLPRLSQSYQYDLQYRQGRSRPNFGVQNRRHANLGRLTFRQSQPVSSHASNSRTPLHSVENDSFQQSHTSDPQLEFKFSSLPASKPSKDALPETKLWIITGQQGTSKFLCCQRDWTTERFRSEIRKQFRHPGGFSLKYEVVADDGTKLPFMLERGPQDFPNAFALLLPYKQMKIIGKCLFIVVDLNMLIAFCKVWAVGYCWCFYIIYRHKWHWGWICSRKAWSPRNSLQTAQAKLGPPHRWW